MRDQKRQLKRCHVNLMPLILKPQYWRKGETEDMILYHTSDVVISEPDIHYGRKNADFGQGFYMTPDMDFSYRWAWKDAVMNRYELDLSGLRVHTFERTIDWFEYIFHNRRGKDMLDCDVVIGPIANDTIFDTLGIISSGFLSSEDALQLLQIGPEYTQVAIKSNAAAERLRWLGAEHITGVHEYRKSLQKEKEEYEVLFAKTINEMTDE